MPVYQINYDLRNQRDYSSLIKKIQAYGTYAKPLESCWIIFTDQSASQVGNNLASVMDADDGLLVTRLHSDIAWKGIEGNTDGAMSKWLKKYLGQAA